MDNRVHAYTTTVRWTGNTGPGTSTYRSYERAHEISALGKPTISGSSDPAFRGNSQRWSPEDLLVASLSACHLLVFLHRAASAGVIVVGYVDEAIGVMEETDSGGGFREVVLRPHVTVPTAEMAARCEQLHSEAHEGCFIASSVSFPVRHEPTEEVLDSSVDDSLLGITPGSAEPRMR